MNRTDAEKIITEYLKPIFGFALKRCRSIHDAEDLSQEILTKAFRALLAKDDIGDAGKYIWTVAHNTLSNDRRDSVRHGLQNGRGRRGLGDLPVPGHQLRAGGGRGHPPVEAASR